LRARRLANRGRWDPSRTTIGTFGSALATAAALLLATTRLAADERDERSQDDGLSDEEERLFNRVRGGDLDARQELIERYLPLAQRLARRYWYGREPLDDLFQVAGMGLVKAVDRFDPERRMPFPAYAVPTILGELKRHFRDTGWVVRVPQRLQTRVVEVERTADELRRQLGRSPHPAEVAEAAGVSVQEVVEAAEVVAATDVVSLDSVPGEDRGESLRNTLGVDDERYDLIEYEASIQPALKALPARERLILHLRFSEDLTQFEIGELMGISQMHVSRLLRRSLTRLRAVAEAGAA
jgi:RNA polymerase sigma-B factor